MTLKNKIIEHLFGLVESKRKEALAAIESARESRDRDTKSSAGDKHETSRAMIQIELDKAQAQLAKADSLRADLGNLDTHKTYSKVEVGSLLLTNHGFLFLSIGIGKVRIDDQEVFIISMGSPIGQVLKGLEAGDLIRFQGRNWEVKEIR